MKHLLLAVLISLSIIPTAFADDEYTVCAALRPCNGQGDIFPEFKGGACEAVYKEQCENITSVSTASLIERRYAQCKNSSKKKDGTIRSLKKQLRAAIRAKQSSVQ